jgi:hypothetical protein
MGFLGSLLRVAAGGALLAVILLAVARIGARVGVRSAAGIPDTLLAIGPDRLQEIALLGAGVAVGSSLLNRMLPEGIARALRGGFWTGAIAMVFFQQGATFLLFHLSHTVPDPGFSLAPMPAWGHMPQLVALALAGGVAGLLLSLVLRLLPLPDLLAGIAAGTLGLSLLSDSLPVPPLATEAPGWWVNLLANGAWGLGAAMLMRPLVLRSEGD